MNFGARYLRVWVSLWFCFLSVAVAQEIHENVAVEIVNVYLTRSEERRVGKECRL